MQLFHPNKHTANQNFIRSTCSSILPHIMTVIKSVRELSTFNRIKISTLPHTKECHNTPTCVTPTSQHSQSISIISLTRTLLRLVLASGLITCGFLSNTEGISHLPIRTTCFIHLVLFNWTAPTSAGRVKITKLLTTQYCPSSCCFNSLRSKHSDHSINNPKLHTTVCLSPNI